MRLSKLNNRSLQPARMFCSQTGFTLIELMLAFSVLVTCICGLLLAYINMFILSDLSRDLTMANSAMQAKMEQIKKVDFRCLLVDAATTCPTVCNGTCYRTADTFDLEGMTDAKGRIEISSIEGYSDLKEVRLVSSFKSRNRIIGEDKNLNGQLDTGEDTYTVNNRLDSPAELVTLISK